MMLTPRTLVSRKYRFINLPAGAIEPIAGGSQSGAICDRLTSDMNVQIFGTRKSSDTRKAMRFFSERRIAYHFRDLSEKGLSRGELDNICRTVDPADIIDAGSPRYKKRGMNYMDFDPIEEVLEDPLLVKMPVVRCGKSSTVGYSPDVWKRWISDTV
jgi:arsenate reductase-like glutaredoxin family protein